MTITNPVGQQPTPTHHHCGTRGGKQEWNLHTKGCSSPSKPPAGGRASGRQSRGIGNRRTGRHTRNYWTITGNLCATSPPKCSTLYHSLPFPQPRASTTPTLHSPTPHPQVPPLVAAAVTNVDEMTQHPLCAVSGITASGNDVWSSLRLRKLRKLPEAQGAMRASRAYREVIVSARARCH